METRTLKVVDKAVTYNDAPLICGNKYNFVFDFDEEWNEYSKKVARFIVNGVATDVEFSGNTCISPSFSRVKEVTVGVFVEGEIATTEVKIPCWRSILCNGVTKEPIYNGEYELLVPTVSGVWYFNETLSLFNAFNADYRYPETVKFTSNSMDYIGITLHDASPDGMQIVYDSEDELFSVINYEYDNWVDQAYRTVDFGTEPQEVSEEFYAWLTANAVKQ